MELSVHHLYEVLSRAPAYLNCKFRSVSPEVDFSMELNYCRQQARNMLQRGDMHVFAFPDVPAPMGMDFYHLFDNGPSPGLPIQFLNLFNSYWRILASWNGLVLIEFEIVDSKPPKPCICNPVTGYWALLRSPMEDSKNRHELGMQIVFVPSDTVGNDYKLICIAGVEHRWLPPYVIKEFNFVEYDWQVIEGDLNFGLRGLELDQVAVVNDTLYIMSTTIDYSDGEHSVSEDNPPPFIGKYSFGEKKKSTLPLPIEAAQDPFHGEYGVFKWGSRWTSTESLCLVRNIGPTFTFWTSSLEGAPGSWVLIQNLNIGQLGILDDLIKGFTVVNGECLIFATRFAVYGFNVNGDYPWKFKVLGPNTRKTYVKFISYSSTFRPINSSIKTTFRNLLALLTI
ncbi:uncharacterized protein LOC130744464 [Lotus japonicus]|uniref:uncharacterized protein LOC130744464 n=1 Tax=Lotus japonicus TaxID=34305 RepID=UPI00258465C3|nr:uncharacterized protein LOC130744464 [Lotus japonicus]